MITYLFIGVLVAILLDLVLKQIPNTQLQFTNWERLFIITLWPVAIIYTINGFFKKNKQ
jgi:hypothetical protein